MVLFDDDYTIDFIKRLLFLAVGVCVSPLRIVFFQQTKSIEVFAGCLK